MVIEPETVEKEEVVVAPPVTKKFDRHGTIKFLRTKNMEQKVLIKKTNPELKALLAEHSK